jgi:hypothetical protein
MIGGNEDHGILKSLYFIRTYSASNTGYHTLPLNLPFFGGDVGRSWWRCRKKLVEMSEEAGGDVGRSWWRCRKELVEMLEETGGDVGRHLHASR